MKTVFVTGGAGFIGSNLVRVLLNKELYNVVVIDKLTYAGNLESLDSISDNKNYVFEKADICDLSAMKNLFDKYRPDGVFHLAAESHVDRSIDSAADFINTNILGTYSLLEASREYYHNNKESKSEFRFLHVSTDEVYGSLSDTGFFTEKTPYAPKSPYSASKASSDHLARAWYNTYKLPVLVTNCSNNYGPYQFPEKLIPVIILNALKGNKLPVYGKGENVRDWLYVEDHARALEVVFRTGETGDTYNIGGHNEKRNIDIVLYICRLLDERIDGNKIEKHEDLIEFVIDRPGHDYRYAIDASYIDKKLGWKPEENFESGIEKTVDWYLKNLDWCDKVMQNKYQLERLGNT